VDDPAFQACVTETWLGQIVSTMPSRKRAARVSTREHVEPPLAEDSWAFTAILVTLSGGVAIPTFIFSALLGDFSSCAKLVAGSYALPALLIVGITRYYRDSDPDRESVSGEDYEESGGDYEESGEDSEGKEDTTPHALSKRMNCS
jgi:hypothetical protein